MPPFNNDIARLNDALQTLINANTDALMLKDGVGRYILVNRVVSTFFEQYKISWKGKTATEISAQFPKLSHMLTKCLTEDDEAWAARKEVIFNDRSIELAGEVRDYELRKIPIFEESGKRKWLVVIGRDVTHRKLEEHNLRIAEAAIESLQAIVITDANNRILRVNSSFTKLTGYQPEEVIGKSTSILKSGRHDKTFYKAMWKELTDNKFWQGELWDKRKNGEIYPKWLTITAVTSPDNKLVNYVGAFTDLSEHKEAKDAIHRLAFYDPLTDLPNRRLLSDRLNLAISNAARNLDIAAVLMIDLDNFKNINDTKGHAIGDLLLIEVGSRLKSCVREGDTVARLGGDEFVIVLEHLSNDSILAVTQAETVSRKILNAINHDYIVANQQLYCSLSIGVSMLTQPPQSSGELLKQADAAMYQAKSAGRNRMCFFDPELHASLEQRLNLESDLRLALSDNQLKLYFQPQVDHQYNIIGAEILLRWEHPKLGFIQPNDFIPLAEETGLILPIGAWVIMEACWLLKRWEESPYTQHLILAVNVSARQFAQSDFVEIVCKALEDTSAKATLLKIEITESLVMKDVSDTIKKMEALKLVGVQFSIDDFGTGYSSLAYLKRLPINQLKIDRSFVREIDVNDNDAIIAQTIIGMAKNLGIKVIAEGVETEEQRLCLEQFNCPYFQGFLFSKAVNLDEFEKLFKAQSQIQKLI